MINVSELLAKSIPWLKAKGVENAKLDAETLLAKVLGCKRLELILQFERPVATAEQDAYRELMKRRGNGEPVAYLVGTRGFHELEFAVGPGVLVPRPETELLVELGAARAGRPRADGSHARILDVGTGSGCIAISLAHQLPDATVIAVDRSKEALAIARRNVDALAPGRVELRESDGFGAVRADERFDVIVSNPPYIPSGDIAGLMRDVRDFEPRAALDGGGDGLACIRPWAKEAFARLAPGGWCFFEIGAGQGDAARACFAEAGFVEISLTDDLARIPRVVGGMRP